LFSLIFYNPLYPLLKVIFSDGKKFNFVGPMEITTTGEISGRSRSSFRKGTLAVAQ